MQIAAAEVLRADRLAGRRLHQRRAAEEDRALLFDDDGFVRHRRDIGAARGARSHDDSDLGDPVRRHAGLVEEDPAEMLAVREHLRLMRQIGAAGVDQIDARQMVFGRDLLRAQMLLDGHGIIGAALDGRIIGDDHRLAAMDQADPGNEPGAVNVPLIHTVSGERADFQKRRTGIDEARDAFARKQLAAPDMPVARLCRAALGRRAAARLQFVDQTPPAGDVRVVFVRWRGQPARQPCHVARFPGSRSCMPPG